MNKKLALSVAPIIIFIVLIVIFWFALSKDPKKLNSNLINKPFPEFQLASLHNPINVLTQKDLPQELFLLNVWATWCGPCHVEHPYLKKFSQNYPIEIVGVNYKDQTADALNFLKNKGNPYSMVISDPAGRLGIDLGVYGAPETYIIDSSGTIRFRYVGVVDDRVWETKIQPVIATITGNRLPKVPSKNQRRSNL